ncbi:MAG TPA: hypothetical protein PLR83_10515, partial [Pyrinomonadaceae bacterium]|nr:hypothetical protein [Pyrinomonadaceae bacterium]
IKFSKINQPSTSLPNRGRAFEARFSRFVSNFTKRHKMHKTDKTDKMHKRQALPAGHFVALEKVPPRT